MACDTTKEFLGTTYLPIKLVKYLQCHSFQPSHKTRTLFYLKAASAQKFRQSFNMLEFFEYKSKAGFGTTLPWVPIILKAGFLFVIGETLLVNLEKFIVFLQQILWATQLGLR